MADGHTNLFIASGVRRHVPLYVQLTENDLVKSSAQKAIEGQQAVGAQISSKDPMYATHKPDIHVEAAKHYIQADHHSRQPGGQTLADHHNQQFSKLQQQGAQPRAEHFKTAMYHLPSHMTQAMRSLEANPKLFVST